MSVYIDGIKYDNYEEVTDVKFEVKLNMKLVNNDCFNHILNLIHTRNKAIVLKIKYLSKNSIDKFITSQTLLYTNKISKIYFINCKLESLIKAVEYVNQNIDIKYITISFDTIYLTLEADDIYFILTLINKDKYIGFRCGSLQTGTNHNRALIISFIDTILEHDNLFEFYTHDSLLQRQMDIIINNPNISSLNLPGSCFRSSNGMDTSNLSKIILKPSLRVFTLLSENFDQQCALFSNENCKIETLKINYMRLAMVETLHSSFNHNLMHINLYQTSVDIEREGLRPMFELITKKLELNIRRKTAQEQSLLKLCSEYICDNLKDENRTKLQPEYQSILRWCSS